jgi:hypothetical protein
MSNLIVIAIVVFVLALAAIPAALRAQADDTVVVTGKIQFLENGKVLHDTGVPVKNVTGLATGAGKIQSKDNITEKVALDCNQVDVEAVAQGNALTDKGIPGESVSSVGGFRETMRPSGPDCTYELRLPARDASYKVALAVVGFSNAGSIGSKVAIKSGIGDVTSAGWNLVKNISGESISTGKLPIDSKVAKHVIVKALGPDVVKVGGDKNDSDIKSIAGESSDVKKVPDKGALSAFRAVPSSVDFAVDIPAE